MDISFYKFRVLPFIIIAVIFSSCLNARNEDDCLTNILSFKGLEFHLIIKKKSINGKNITLTGTNPISGLPDRFFSSVGYMYINYDLYNVGDTITKDNGEFYIKVKKRNKTYLLSLGCYNLKTDSILYNQNSILKKN